MSTRVTITPPGNTYTFPDDLWKYGWITVLGNLVADMQTMVTYFLGQITSNASTVAANMAAATASAAAALASQLAAAASAVAALASQNSASTSATNAAASASAAQGYAASAQNYATGGFVNQVNQLLLDRTFGIVAFPILSLQGAPVTIIDNTPNGQPSWLQFGQATGWFTGH